MASNFCLSSLCGRCFRPVHPTSGGFILSCSDFLCFNCAKTNIPGNVTSCCACGKQGIHALSLCESLPEEVQMSMSDPIANLASVGESMQFQIKYYKQTFKKMLSRISQLSKENAHLKGYITLDLLFTMDLNT